MAGHITKKGQNYYVVIETGEYDGERNRQTISVRKEMGLNRPALKREARDLLAKLLVDQMDGNLIKSTDLTVKEYFSNWLEFYMEKRKHNTKKSYSHLMDKHIVPGLGSHKLSQLQQPHIKKFIFDKLESGRLDGKGGLSSETVKQMLIIIKMVLDTAVEDELIKKNVARRVSAPKVSKPKVEYLDRRQAKVFLQNVKNDRLYALYLLALTTGMRPGELLGLRWQDVDFKQCRIVIKQIVMEGKLIQDGAKTKYSSRTIDISKTVLTELRQHRKRQAQEYLVYGNKGGYSLVFTHKNGDIINPTHAIKLLSAAANMRITFRMLRHTHATLLLESGVHPKIVSERLGHSNITTTLDTYTHALPNIQKAAASLMDDLL